MTNTFKSITGIEYTSNDLQTRFYATDAEGKKTRISRKAYEEAKATYEQLAADERMTEEERQGIEDMMETAEQKDEWEAEAEAEREAREAKIAEDAKATEDAINGKAEKKEAKKDQPKAEKKERKPRKSKDVAFEDEEQKVTLTAKQVDFILHLSDSDFWTEGLDSSLWCDVLCDEIGGQFEGKPMTIGAMISTLCEKGLADRTKDRMVDASTGRTRKGTTFSLTIKGKLVAEKLGLK